MDVGMDVHSLILPGLISSPVSFESRANVQFDQTWQYNTDHFDFRFLYANYIEYGGKGMVEVDMLNQEMMSSKMQINETSLATWDISALKWLDQDTLSNVDCEMTEGVGRYSGRQYISCNFLSCEDDIVFVKNCDNGAEVNSSISQPTMPPSTDDSIGSYMPFPADFTFPPGVKPPFGGGSSMPYPADFTLPPGITPPPGLPPNFFGGGGGGFPPLKSAVNKEVVGTHTVNSGTIRQGGANYPTNPPSFSFTFPPAFGEYTYPPSFNYSGRYDDVYTSTGNTDDSLYSYNADHSMMFMDENGNTVGFENYQYMPSVESECVAFGVKILPAYFGSVPAEQCRYHRVMKSCPMDMNCTLAGIQLIASLATIGTPSIAPSLAPMTIHPTTLMPTDEPSQAPADFVTNAPTKTPSFAPSVSMVSDAPTIVPSYVPSKVPSYAPSITPSEAPSASPTATPTTASPSITPSFKPTVRPSQSPTYRPSAAPTYRPTQRPYTQRPTPPVEVPTTAEPTLAPTAAITTMDGSMSMGGVDVSTMSNDEKEVMTQGVTTAIADVTGMAPENIRNVTLSNENVRRSLSFSIQLTTSNLRPPANHPSRVHKEAIVLIVNYKIIANTVDLYNAFLSGGSSGGNEGGGGGGTGGGGGGTDLATVLAAAVASKLTAGNGTAFLTALSTGIADASFALGVNVTAILSVVQNAEVLSVAVVDTTPTLSPTRKPTSTPVSSSSSSTADAILIIGVVVGVGGGIITLLALVWFFFYGSKKNVVMPAESFPHVAPYNGGVIVPNSQVIARNAQPNVAAL
jgi:hypothetical protein